RGRHGRVTRVGEANRPVPALHTMALLDVYRFFAGRMERLCIIIDSFVSKSRAPPSNPAPERRRIVYRTHRARRRRLRLDAGAAAGKRRLKVARAHPRAARTPPPALPRHPHDRGLPPRRFRLLTSAPLFVYLYTIFTLYVRNLPV